MIPDKESVAQVPHPQRLVGEVLILYLAQFLRCSFSKRLKLCIANQFVTIVYGCFESVFLIHKIQYAEEDDEQFLIEVHLPFFVYRIQINHTILLYDGTRAGNGPRPVYLVHARVLVLDGEGEEVLIFFVKANHGQDYVEETLRPTSLSLSL